MFMIASWRISEMATLKSLSNNYSLPVGTSLWASVNCLFLFKLRFSWLLVWLAILDCSLDISYYVKTHWILLNSCIVYQSTNWLPLTPRSQGNMDTNSFLPGCETFGVGSGTLLLLGGGESHDSLPGILWHHSSRERAGFLLTPCWEWKSWFPMWFPRTLWRIFHYCLAGMKVLPPHLVFHYATLAGELRHFIKAWGG